MALFPSLLYQLSVLKRSVLKCLRLRSVRVCVLKHGVLKRVFKGGVS